MRSTKSTASTKFTKTLEGSANITAERIEAPVALGGYVEPRPRSRPKKVVLSIIGVAAVLALIAAVSGYFYWQSMKTTPQYSLALIVDAAKRNDQSTVNQLVDINAVVDDFLPQITNKAVELYGRGMPSDTIQKVARVAAPVMPAVKDRAREELPGVIRQKTSEFGFVPFEAMVLGADQYLDIAINGNEATVKSIVPEHDFEVKMKRDGERWKIVAVKDEKLATTIAQKIGQEILAIAANGTSSSRSRLGVKNINELLNEAEKIFR